MLLLLLQLLLLTACPPPAHGRRNKAAARRHDQHRAPLPTATGSEITSPRWLTAMERDGTLPVTYGGEVTPSNGALFSEPVPLEPCTGGWRCAKRTKSPEAVWELQSRDGDVAFCDFATVSVPNHSAMKTG